LPNENPVFHLSGPHRKAFTCEAGAKPGSLLLISDIHHQESSSVPWSRACYRASFLGAFRMDPRPCQKLQGQALQLAGMTKEKEGFLLKTGVG